MELIEATNDDLKILTELNIQLRADEKIDNIMTDEEVKKRMIDFLTDVNYVIFLLKENDLVYGYALLNKGKKPVYLRQLFIKREFRDKGLGKLIVTELLEKLHISDIDVEVMIWNKGAIKFYESFGFKQRYLGLRYKK